MGVVIILNQFVCAESLFTLLTVHQRVRESSQMSAGNPCLGIHQNSTVNAYVVGALHDELLPPGFLYIIFQFHTQVAIIPGIGQAAVNLRTWIHKAPVLGQCHDFLHCLFHICILSS